MLQGGEILIILLIALVVLGPTRLPELARKLGSWTAELRAAAKEITAGLEAEVNQVREVGRELKAPLDDIKKPLKDIEGDLKKANPKYEWKGPKPVSGPTPDEAMADYERLQEMERQQIDPGSDEGVAPEETE
jgi:Tat protein translocase TatB subunit